MAHWGPVVWDFVVEPTVLTTLRIFGLRLSARKERFAQSISGSFNRFRVLCNRPAELVEHLLRTWLSWVSVEGLNVVVQLLVDEVTTRLVRLPPNLKSSKLLRIGKELAATTICFPFNHLWDICVIGRIAWTLQRTNPDTNNGVISVGDVLTGHRGMGSALILSATNTVVLNAMTLYLEPLAEGDDGNGNEKRRTEKQKDNSALVRKCGIYVGHCVVACVVQTALETILLRVSLRPDIYRGGIWGTASQIYQEEGFGGFFKGFLPNLVWNGYYLARDILSTPDD